MNMKKLHLASTKLMPLALVFSLTACHAQSNVSVSSSTSTSSGPSGTTSSNVEVTTVDGKTFINGRPVNIDTSKGVNVTTVNGKTTVNGQPLETLIDSKKGPIDVRPDSADSGERIDGQPLTDKPGNNINMSVNKNEDAEKGSGKVSSETRDLKSFSQLEVAGSIDAEVKLGAVPSVQIEIDDNLLNNIGTTVNGDTLHVTTKNSYSSKHPAKLVITAARPLKDVQHNGIGTIYLNNAIAPDSFNVDLTGMGDVHGQGKVDNLKVTVSGVGAAHFDKLQARDAIVELSGVGDAFVNVTGNLNVATDGTGKVRYRGNPKIQHKGSGIGEVIPITQ